MAWLLADDTLENAISIKETFTHRNWCNISKMCWKPSVSREIEFGWFLYKQPTGHAFNCSLRKCTIPLWNSVLPNCICITAKFSPKQPLKKPSKPQNLYQVSKEILHLYGTNEVMLQTPSMTDESRKDHCLPNETQAHLFIIPFLSRFIHVV